MSDPFGLDPFPSDAASSLSGSARDWLLANARRLIQFHRSQLQHWEAVEKALSSEAKRSKASAPPAEPEKSSVRPSLFDRARTAEPVEEQPKIFQMQKSRGKINQETENSTAEEDKPPAVIKKLPTPPLPQPQSAPSPPMPPLPNPANPLPAPTASAGPAVGSGVANPNSALARRHSAFMDGLAAKLGGGGRGAPTPPAPSHQEDEDEESRGEHEENLNKAILSRGAMPKRRRPTKLLKPANTTVKFSSAAPLPMTFVGAGDADELESFQEEEEPESHSQPVASFAERASGHSSLPSSPRGDAQPSRSKFASPSGRQRNFSFDQSVTVIEPDEDAGDAPALPFKPKPRGANPPLPLPSQPEVSDELSEKLKRRALPTPPLPTPGKPAESSPAPSSSKPAATAASTNPMAAAAASAGQKLQRQQSVKKQEAEEESAGPSGELMKKLQKKRDLADGTGGASSAAAPAPASPAQSSPPTGGFALPTPVPKASKSAAGGGGGSASKSAGNDCKSCGCTDFKPDAFKKNRCQNCFHDH